MFHWCFGYEYIIWSFGYCRLVNFCRDSRLFAVMAAKSASEAEEDDKPKVNPYKLGTYDLVRLRINRLMEHPEVPVVIPESTRNIQPKGPPEFVRNVWGKFFVFV
ncbi:unnamed protein product [Dibothriocephalus latus]|uniref:Uncharacterized protein n=1 Tax=Dibothriocephalus latus TaxID=60516 RepID=A0A3P6TZD1_DIBLA|nr:unnamed protein product [Dibothriocephalus latus]